MANEMFLISDFLKYFQSDVENIFVALSFFIQLSLIWV